MDYLISINNINKSFGTKKILNDISFDISKKDIVGLIGLNGAGKSTLISIILGLIAPDSGSISLNSSLVIGSMQQEVNLPEYIKVFELIQMITKFSKNPKTVNEILDITNLQPLKNTICTKLSGGQKRQLQFALAIANNPNLLILDEPTVGMDFITKKNFFKYLNNISNNISIILTSHDLTEFQEFCNRIIILNDSKIIYDKKSNEVSDSLPKILKISLNKLDLNILKTKNLAFSKYEVYNEYIEIYSNNIDLLITQLSQFHICLNDFEILNIKLEKIIENILNKEVAYE